MIKTIVAHAVAVAVALLIGHVLHITVAHGDDALTAPETSCETRCKDKCPWYETAQCVDHCVSGRPPTCSVAPEEAQPTEWHWHWPTCHDNWPDCVPPTFEQLEEHRLGHKSCETRCNEKACNVTPADVIACVDHCIEPFGNHKPKCEAPFGETDE